LTSAGWSGAGLKETCHAQIRLLASLVCRVLFSRRGTSRNLINPTRRRMVRRRFPERKPAMRKYSIAYRKRDDAGIVSGAGWVILENGVRADWPMLKTREEAESDLRGFWRELRALAREESAERRGLAAMEGW
jgi:hypothetical protein